jgi:hypothetical protein
MRIKTPFLTYGRPAPPPLDDKGSCGSMRRQGQIAGLAAAAAVILGALIAWRRRLR